MPTLVYDQAPPAPLRVYRATDGSLHAEGVSLAEGVMDYGGGVLELITRDAVLSAGELDARAVVTLGHPDEEITPDNYRRYTAGDTGSATEVRPTKGGFAACYVDMALRSADAVAAAERGELTGLSRGHIPIRVDEAGNHPVFGPYTRKRTGHIGDTNHIALCGRTDALPPPRGGKTCGIFLDSQPKRPTMKRPTNRAEWRAFFASDAVKPIVAKLIRRKGTNDAAGKPLVKDEVDLQALVTMLTEAMADPESIPAIVCHAVVNRGAEASEIMAGGEGAPLLDAPPMDPAMMEKQMDAAIVRHLTPLKAELDTLRAEKTARDAQATAQGDATLRKLAADLGVKDAATVAIDALVTPMAARLGISVDGLDASAARTAVTATARLKAALPSPRLPTNDAGTGPVIHARSTGVA